MTSVYKARQSQALPAAAQPAAASKQERAVENSAADGNSTFFVRPADGNTTAFTAASKQERAVENSAADGNSTFFVRTADGNTTAFVRNLQTSHSS